MEELLGSTFLRQKHDKCGLEALEKAKLIGIYFASYWCPPCIYLFNTYAYLTSTIYIYIYI